MREATKVDLPKGIEAQCPICWRIFGSDSTCELHKPYRKPVGVDCKDPISIGLSVRERRGLKIYVRSIDDTSLQRIRERASETSAVSDQQAPDLPLREPPWPI